MVLSPAPIDKPKEEVSAKRALAYEQALAQRREASDAPANEDPKKDIPAFETVTSEAPPASAGIDDAAADRDLPANGDLPASQDMTSQDMAALPDANAGSEATAAMPPLPGEPGAEQWGTDAAEPWGDEGRQDWAYGRPPPPDPYGPPPRDPYRQRDVYGPPPGDPYREDEPYDPQSDLYQPPGDPYAGQVDPYAGQAEGADENTEEWVQVIVSGTPMRATASEEAPMLFAFPYGRSLKVVSRYEGWVEVADAKSSATGWMPAHALAPSAAPRPYGQGQAYYDEPRQERRGIFRRGGFSDMINRALGGGN